MDNLPGDFSGCVPCLVSCSPILPTVFSPTDLEEAGSSARGSCSFVWWAWVLPGQPLLFEGTISHLWAESINSIMCALLITLLGSILKQCFHSRVTAFFKSLVSSVLVIWRHGKVIWSWFLRLILTASEVTLTLWTNILMVSSRLSHPGEKSGQQGNCWRGLNSHQTLSTWKLGDLLIFRLLLMACHGENQGT